MNAKKPTQRFIGLEPINKILRILGEKPDAQDPRTSTAIWETKTEIEAIVKINSVITATPELNWQRRNFISDTIKDVQDCDSGGIVAGDTYFEFIIFSGKLTGKYCVVLKIVERQSKPDLV